jgi:hypothetical protein
MKLLAYVFARIVFMIPVALCARNKKLNPEPTAWGALTGNVSWVIFAEGHKTSGRFYGIAVTTTTVGKLVLIETQNYQFNQEQIIETQENLDRLMQMAQKDHVKFVKIPEKYSPELLEKARASCKSDAR